MENYFEKDTFIIRYDEENHLLIHQWKISPVSQEFREGTNALITAFEKFKTGKLVADVRELGAVHPDDQQWIITDWSPRARKAGFSHSAVIIPQDIFTQMALDAMTESDNQIRSQNFDNIKMAIDWLKQF